MDSKITAALIVALTFSHGINTYAHKPSVTGVTGKTGVLLPFYIFIFFKLKIYIRSKDLPVPPVTPAFHPLKTRVKVSQAN